MWYKLVINLESRFITDILPSDAARPRGQYISYKPPSQFISLTYTKSKNVLIRACFVGNCESIRNAAGRLRRFCSRLQSKSSLCPLNTGFLLTVDLFLLKLPWHTTARRTGTNDDVRLSVVYINCLFTALTCFFARNVTNPTYVRQLTTFLILVSLLNAKRIFFRTNNLVYWY